MVVLPRVLLLMVMISRLHIYVMCEFIALSLGTRKCPSPSAGIAVARQQDLMTLNVRPVASQQAQRSAVCVSMCACLSCVCMFVNTLFALLAT